VEKILAKIKDESMVKPNTKCANRTPNISGILKVYNPKVMLFHLFFLKSPMSISNPAKNMMYKSPVVPLTTMLLSLDNTLNPLGPMMAPAMIRPNKCGTFILLSKRGALRIMTKTNRNFRTGSSIGRLREFMLRNIIVIILMNG
jgi:hypothetical protein